MTQGEQGYFLSHLVLRLRHWRQLRFLTLLLLPGIALLVLVLAGAVCVLEGALEAAVAEWLERSVGETLARLLSAKGIATGS